MELGPIPDLVVDSNVTFTYVPDTWAQSVKVGINTKVSGYELQYSLDDGVTWNKYTEEITVTKNNQAVLARLADGDRVGGTAIGNVDKIDTLEPKTFEINQGETTSKSIEVTVNAEDEEATLESGKSEVKEYRFSSDNGNTWSESQISGTYTFDNLVENFGGTPYSIMVEAKDNAGNIRRSTKEISTIVKSEYYVSEENKLLMSYNNSTTSTTRLFYKTNSEPALVGIVYQYGGDNNIYIGPIIVSTSKEAVYYYTNPSYTFEAWGGSFEYKGKTFHCSSNMYAMDAETQEQYVDVYYPILNTKSSAYANHVESALALLETYFNL